MPCVLPVIPFKIQAVLTEIQSDLRSRILAAASLLAGSLIFFLIIGLATVYLGLIWGELFQSKSFLWILTLFLFFSGIATFFDRSIPLPQMIYNIPAKKYWKAALTGFLAGILSTPCSGPFLGSVLAFSLTLPPGGVILLFLSIGTGLSFPYVVIMVWPNLLSRFKITGIWTVRIKQFFGFILLAGAVFFSRSLMPKGVYLAGWTFLALGLLIWLCMIIIRTSNIYYRVAGFIILGLIILSAAPHIKPSLNNQLNWLTFSEAAVDQAVMNGQPVMIEFTADWCLNCKVLEKTVLSNKKIISAVKNASMISLKSDITNVTQANKDLLSKYKGNALPYLVILNDKGTIVDRFTGMFTVRTLVDAIKKAQ